MGQLSGYITLIDVSDGAPGLNNAIIYLYKRATSTPSNMPTGNLTYTFSTNTITAVETGSSLNGWVQDISTLSGNNTLYFIAATASSTTDTDIIADTEWQGPTLLAESGDDGKGIITTTLTYGVSSSSTVEPANWYSNTPTLNKGDWLWIRTVYTYSDSTTSQFDTKSYIGTDGEDGTSIAIISSTKVGKVTTIVMRETYADGTYADSTITITDGEDGSQGQPGQPGTDGRTPYMHFAWANVIGPTSADFEDFSTTVSENKNYIGVYSDYTINDSVNPLDYSWTLTKGVKGDDGTTISTIEYSKDGTNWSELQPTLTQGDWLYVKTTYTDGSSATSKSYIGTDGEDGTAVSIVSSTKIDGVTTIVMRTTYPDSTYVDSTITITDGEDGDDGQPGQPGTDGRTPYTHFAWANAIGQSSIDFEDFSTSISTNKRYIGVFSDYNVSDSQNPLDYSWTLTKGENGTDGFNQAIIYLYQRSNATPNKPAGNLTYTFSTGVLSGSLENWTREIPSNSSGYPCYVITAAAISRESTDTIVTNDWSTPIILVEDGTNGAPGVSTATVYLYQRKTTTPSKPTNTLTYTFATKELSGTINNGWSTSLGSLTGTDPIWVIAAVPSSNTASDTITSSEWSTPIKLAQDGTNGLNQATVYIYNRSGISAKPSDTTYTFATGAFTVPTNWSKTIPTKNGNPCWVSSAVAIGNGNTATLTWSNPVVLVEDGTDGISPTVTATATGVKIVDADGNETYINNGSNGDTYYTYIRYSANADGSNYQTTPDPSRPYIGVYSGTESSPPAYSDSGWTWSEYLGTDGVSVTNVRELYWLKTNSTNPSQITWNSSTSQPSQTIYSDTNSNHWTSMVPTYVTNGIYYTCIETSLSNGTKVWSVPVINQALTSANTNASEALNKVQAKYATSSTSAATAAKVAIINPAIDSWSLFNGAEIFVKFTNKNTATSNLTLSIKPSSTGTGTTAAGIRDSDGNTLAEKFYWKDNSLVHFVYDGTYWRILDIVTTEKYNNLITDINGLSSTVGEHTTSIGSLGTRVGAAETNITQNATSITSLASNQTTYTAPDGSTQTNTIASAISQNATNIDLKVSKDGVIQAINISNEGITIDADKVNITGAAIFTSGRLSEDSLNNAYRDAYAISESSGSSSAKTTQSNTPAGFTLYDGATVTIKFNNANTATTPTLNVNGTGAKTIKSYTGAALTAAEYQWPAGAIITFVYDGTYWRMQDEGALQSVAEVAGNLTTEINQRKANYGTSSTSASARAKVVTCADFELVAGNELTVKFSTANTYTSNSIQLNVNNKGVKDVWVANAVTSSTNQLLWGANAYITFRYDGAQFIVIGEPRVWYGASTTPAATAAKTDTTAVTGCVICKGAKIELAMSYKNTNDNPTLNIRSTGAKSIYYGNTTTGPTAANGHSWIDSTTATFTFDGQYYRMAGQTVINGDNITTGTIAANLLEVGDWEIESPGGTYGGAIHTGSFGDPQGIVITPGYSTAGSIGGSSEDETQTWFITAGNSFGVTSNGEVYLTDIHIGDVDASVLKNIIAKGEVIDSLIESATETVNYVKTTDTSMVSGKTYYIYDTEDNEYQEFTGNAFDIGVIYYESISPSYNLKSISIHSYSTQPIEYIQPTINIDENSLSFIQNPKNSSSAEPVEVAHFDATLDGIFYVNKLKSNSLIFGELELKEYNDGLIIRRRED